MFAVGRHPACGGLCAGFLQGSCPVQEEGGKTVCKLKNNITMNLNNLKPAEGSTHHDRRIGRGQGSGRGGTSTRGHKGAQSRSGYSRKLGFEGGQMPLQRRLPKYGFTNLKRIELQAYQSKRHRCARDQGQPYRSQCRDAYRRRLRFEKRPRENPR